MIRNTVKKDQKDKIRVLDCCSFKDDSALADAPIATLDCDNGGVDNGTECAEGADPGDPADDCSVGGGNGAAIEDRVY